MRKTPVNWSKIKVLFEAAQPILQAGLWRLPSLCPFFREKIALTI
jgi:hypothetical protein